MWEALTLSLKLAALTTLLLLAFSLILSPLLAFGEFRGKRVLLLLTLLPLVLPPTVLGFYLLLLLSPDSPVGALLTRLFGEPLLFNFKGLLLASLVSSLPLALLPVVGAMETVKREYLETAFVFGYSPLETYLKVVLPLSRGGIVSAALLVFAHTLGEFGVLLMVGGNIPGKTQTLSLFLYDAVQAMDYKTAHKTSLLLLSLSVGVGLLLLSLERRGTFRR